MTRAEKTPPNVTPCYGQGDLFFSQVWAEQEAAKALCGTCQVQVNCLDLALRTTGSDPYTDGVQGGLTPQERGYYRRLYPGRVTVVQVLPVRYRNKPPKTKTKKKGRAA